MTRIDALHYIEAHPGCTARDMVVALGITHGGALRAMTTAMGRGHVRRERRAGQWRWYVTHAAPMSLPPRSAQAAEDELVALDEDIADLERRIEAAMLRRAALLSRMPATPAPSP